MAIEVGEDEADKKRRYYQEVLARRGQGDRTVLRNPKPDKHYRWRHALTPADLEKYRHDGWTAVDAAKNPDVAGYASTVAPDNTHRIKDMVLMEEDRELHELKKAQNRERRETQQRRAIENAREAIEKKARDIGLSSPHQSITVQSSRSGGESSFVRRKLPE